MSTYTDFTLEELKAALPSNTHWEEVIRPSDKEVVYGADLGGYWRCLVYTGVLRSSGHSREVGQDAVRLVLVDMVSNRGVFSSTRVHRTGTPKSLQARLLQRFNSALEVRGATTRCIKCGAALVDRVRKSDGKPFKGCIQFDKCKELSGSGAYAKPASSSTTSTGPSVSGADRSRSVTNPATTTVSPGAGPVRSTAPSVAALPLNGEPAPPSLIATRDFPLLKFPFEYFNPVQSQVFPYLDDDVNLVVCAKTSAGKTAIAELFLAKCIFIEKKRGLFLSPLKAVTQEKYDEWKDRFQKTNISIVTGDYQLTPKRQEELAAAGLVLMTSEMLDSRTRRMTQENNFWLNEAGVLVVDEFHLTTMPDRGHCLESGLMRFSHLNPRARMIALSATMPNVADIGSWLTKLNGKKTELIVSDWRPVPHEVHYVPHATSGNNWGYATEIQIQKAKELVLSNVDDKWLIFVHSKAIGRKLEGALRDVGLDVRFHNADLSLAERQELDAAFREK